MAFLCATLGVLMKRSFVALLLNCCLMPAYAQDSQEPVSVPEDGMQKLLIHRVKPALPEEPGTRIPGMVVFNALINKSGGVESLQMISGHPTLIPAALEAAKQWRYKPYEVNGIRRAVETVIRVEFSNTSAEEAEGSVAQARSLVLLTAEDIPAQLVYRVAPIYPPLARQARIQGTVILRIIINQSGEVRDTQLISGHPMLTPAAMEAVKKWRYIPYESDGSTVEVHVVQVIFRLAGG
jgi:protein TonB